MGRVITATAYRGSVEKRIPAEGISEFIDGGGLVWADIIDPTDDEFECLADELELHPLAIEDARKGNQRPKIERYPTHAFIVVYGPDPDPRELPELHVFVGKGWLLTLRLRNSSGRALEFESMAEEFSRTRGEECGVGFLLHSILDVIVDGYFDVTDKLDEELERIEEALFSDLDPSANEQQDRDMEVHQGLLQLRRELVVFRRRVVPLREVLMTLLRREYKFISDELVPYMQDVLDHLLRTIDQVDGQRELVGNAVDAHLAIISNRSNEIMKKMTSWGAILLGSTLIAGIYGMNFRHMPELGNRFGYPGALLAMALLTVVLYVYFHRKRWL